MTVQSENERNKAVVDEYFKAGVQGHLTSFAAYLHPDFTVTAPNYLPWGGRHVGAAFFRDHLLPSVTDVLRFRTVQLRQRHYLTASALRQRKRKSLLTKQKALRQIERKVTNG